MSSSSVESAALSALQSSYTAYETEETTGGSTLGTEDFLTLLVAQLENQNPLDPTDTSSFTDQLAQYTQVEQLINLNDKMDAMLEETTESESTVNAPDYIGMQITGEANTMTIADGSVTSGYYTLSDAAEVAIVISDDQGNVVTTLFNGQQEAGSFNLTWDGTDDSGNAVDEGTYTYAVMANTGSGYGAVSSTITGTVDSVVYQNGTASLVVDGVLLDPSSITSMGKTAAIASNGTTTSILEYLGKTVASDYPIVQVDGGGVTGGDLSYSLDTPEDATVTVYNASDEAVATIEVASGVAVAGENKVYWDALADTGSPVSDGLYYYTVATESSSATTPVSGEVMGIQYINGVQYLALGESDRLVSLSTITFVE